jgi:hypothetical protein
VTRPIAVPNVTALAGTVLFGQSACFVPGVNPLGLLTSNGIELRVDRN